MILFSYILAEGVQISEIMAHIEFAHFNHGQDSGCIGKSNFCALHHYFHLCRYGNATLW